jgi:GntR family transcriptional repressor for pyruvate dehydrogenase complex
LKHERKPLHRMLAEQLTDRIIAGEFPAGSFLPSERELGESLGVSRTVIREAVKLLESRGLVRIEQGRGTVVEEAGAAPLGDSLKILLRRNYHQIEQLLETRCILEVGVAGLAAERRTAENLEAMEKFLAVMREKPGELEGYVDADLQFHTEIARAAGNPLFLALFEPLSELLRESRLATFGGARMVNVRSLQHEAILEAIRKRDPSAARGAMREHLLDTRKDLDSRQGDDAERVTVEEILK